MFFERDIFLELVFAEISLKTLFRLCVELLILLLTKIVLVAFESLEFIFKNVPLLIDEVSLLSNAI